MQTREAPDFGGLHKNMNCAFPLSLMKINVERFYIKKIFSNYQETTATKKAKEISKTKKNITCVKYHWIIKQSDLMFHCSITYHVASL